MKIRMSINNRYAKPGLSPSFPDLPPNPLPEGRGDVDGLTYRLCDVPDGDTLSIGVSINDRHATCAFPPSLPVGERAGERGLRGEGSLLTLPFAFDLG